MRYLPLLLLAGCATQDIDPEKASYFMVSQGEASFVYRAFVGGVDYCKGTASNLRDGTVYRAEISYDGESCVVTATVEADHSEHRE